MRSTATVRPLRLQLPPVPSVGRPEDDAQQQGNTGPMDRPKLTITDTWHGYAREAAIVIIPDGNEHAGTWHAELRARLLDEATGDRWFDLSYTIGVGQAYFDNVPAEWVRRPELTDLDGLVPPSVLERMRAEQEDPVCPRRCWTESTAGRPHGARSDRSVPPMEANALPAGPATRSGPDPDHQTKQPRRPCEGGSRRGSDAGLTLELASSSHPTPRPPIDQ